MEIQRQFRNDLNGRVRVLSAIVSLLLGLVAGGFWWVQLVQGSHYRELAENNRLRRLTIRAPRGIIHDRQGQLLVENTPSYQLLVDRSRTEDVDASLDFAAELLGRPRAELEENLQRGRRQPDYQPVPVARNLTLTEVAQLSAQSLEHPEFEIDVGHLRLYRHGPQTAHVLGYLGEVSEAELARNGAAPQFKPGDLVGKKGIERHFDSVLRGDDGERMVIVDSRGRLMQENARDDAESGVDLTLTLDLGLQQEAERLMRDKVGSIVALDPRTGDVLAMVSSPSFDPNLFASGIQVADWQELLGNENDPLQNRAIQNFHSPGSAFKMVMATAGLSEGVIAPQDRVYCNGSVTLHNHKFRCGRLSGHGSVNLEQAMAKSCNVYFYQLGNKLGIDRIEKWAKAFGFGEATGIELDNEKAGLVPGKAWALNERGQAWYPGETISVSIGQGALGVTPLQMARATAAVANGGRLVTPHLLRSGQPLPEPRLPASAETLALVRQAMAGVVEPGGTAYLTAGIEGLRWGGKTGTVQVAAGQIGVPHEDRPFRLRNHAWFASFAPLEIPEIVVVVFNEHGGAGSTGAAPIASDLMRFWFERDGARPALVAQR
jgi:penicillin-binding protein 2